MNDKHPIDDLFRDKLQQQSYESPMHIWDAIAAKRDATPLPPKTIFSWWPWALTATVIISAGLVTWYFNQTPSPVLPERQLSVPLELQKFDPTPPPTARVGAPISNPETLLLLAKQAIEPVDPLPRRWENLHLHPVYNLPTGTLRQAYFRGYTGFMQGSANLTVRSPHPLPVERPLSEIPDLSLQESKVWRSSIDFMVSPSLAGRTIAPESEAFQSYSEVREATEKFRFAYTAGVRYSMVSPSGIALRSGLTLTQIHDRFHHEVVTDENITITTEFGPNGQIISSDTVVDYTTLQYSANNRYTMIDIPILLGYEFQVGEHIRIGLNGGPLVNLVFSQEGEFLSPDSFEPVAFGRSQESASPFRDRLGLSFYGSMGMTYKLSDKLDLLIEPHLNWRPQSVTKGGFGIEQRFLTSGIFLGLRKKV